MNARRRVRRIQQVLEQIGINAERVRMFNMSAAMANEFVSAAQEMTGHIARLGKNPLHDHASPDREAKSES